MNESLFLTPLDRPKTAWFTPYEPVGKTFGGELEVNRPPSMLVIVAVAVAPWPRW